MSNRPEQLRLTPDERAELVAYIDGELPEGIARAISTKVTQSATARREVEMLKKTWELLDHLPRAQLSTEFSEKTLATIRRLEVPDTTWQPALATWSRRLAVGFTYLLMGAVAAGAGYALSRWAWPDPTIRLVRDLTLAEHLDEFEEAGTIEFLGQLAESPEFGADNR
jgi:anti-sigma factor RsiW